MNKVRILLSDFQFLTRQGLVNLLDNQGAFDLKGVIEGPDDLITNILELQPDVLILDYQTNDPIMLGILKKIIQDQATQILLITNDNNREYIQSLLDLGVKGVVTKGCSKKEIIDAIHSVGQGKRFFCNKVLDLLIAPPDDSKVASCEPTELSPREYEVLQLVTKGYKTADIAEALHVSVHTINSHRKNILRKLNLKSPTELIVYAMESGLTKSA